ncbi:MAG: hypothetical protein WDN69_27325 [Aliidongia sp.]
MKERPRAWGFIGFASITGLFLLSHFYGEQILRTLNLVPHNTAFGDTFGAINLLLGVFEIELQYAGSSVEGRQKCVGNSGPTSRISPVGDGQTLARVKYSRSHPSS